MRNMKLIAWLFFGLLMLTIIPMVNTVKADASTTITYYFDNYLYSAWVNPSNMCDGDNATYASTAADAQMEFLDGTNCPGTDLGTITKIEIRVRGYGSGTIHNVYVLVNGGSEFPFVLPTSVAWSVYRDCTADISDDWIAIQSAWAQVTSGVFKATDYVARVELRITYIDSTTILTIDASSVYPVNNSYTHMSVTLSWNCTVGSAYNYTLYKKIGAGAYFLSDTKNNNPSGTTTFYKRWFNATTLNTLYSWKVCMKNYASNNWKNYSFRFYINDSTVHLSDTKTNVAGTLTSIRNNTGVWVTSIHNSSITPYNHAVNSTLTHVYYWVTNTWRDYANSTGNITAIHTSDTKKNVTGSLSYSLNGTGYWVTSIHESKLIQFTNLINAFGTHTKNWNGTSWVDYANVTGNLSVCNSTNLTLYENIVNATGTHQSFYDPLLGWFAWANYSGNGSAPGPGTSNYSIRLNFTGLQGYISWSGDYTGNVTNISFYATANRSINGSINVDEDAYFLSGMLSFDPAVMILSLFFGFFYIGYESKKRSGGFFMLFAGFLLIALGVLVYGMLGYAAVLVVPFAIFIMLLGGKKAFYGPEAEEPQGNKPTK